MSSDFWPVVFPTWLSGIGGVLAAGISTAAFVQSLRNKGGLENFARHDNERTNEMADVQEQAVRWQVERSSKNRRQFVNIGAKEALVRSVTAISRGSEQDLMVVGDLPWVVAPGGAVEVHIERSLASPAVTVVEIEWNEGAAGPFAAAYNVT